jgi:hypothetical protein
MVGTTSYVVKTMKQELEVNDIFLQCFGALVSSIFVELFNSSTSEDLTPPPLSTKLSKDII